MGGMTEGWGYIALAAAGAVVVFAVVVSRRRRRVSGLPAIAEVPLSTLRAILSGMEVAATTLVRDSTVECFGDYRRDPGLLIVEVQTDTEAGANRLIAEADLGTRLTELLTAKGYPPAAIPRVGLTIRSRERLAQEAIALREQGDIARWSGEN